MNNYITTQGNGWYNFEALDQSKSYIKICNLNCGTDRKAINQARKMIGEVTAEIEVVSIPVV